ncbi:hypothetical protein DOY81_002503, partial [Sarcophaga bullata]
KKDNKSLRACESIVWKNIDLIKAHHHHHHHHRRKHCHYRYRG